MRNLLFVSISIVPCLAQQASLSSTGLITGNLRGEDGTAIVGGHVSLALMSPHPIRLRQTEWTTVTGPGGAFQFARLLEGRYRLCAQVPRSTWLNPCEWGLERIVVAVSAAQPVANPVVVMKKGVAVAIRMDDPGQLLFQYEGKTPGAHVLIGVGNDALAFIPAQVTSSDANGRNHQIVIPFNYQAKLTVQSSFYQLADAAGLALARARAVAIPVTVAPGQQPAPITLKVTGRGQ